MFYTRLENSPSLGVGWSKEIEMSPEIMITVAKKNVSAQRTTKNWFFSQVVCSCDLPLKKLYVLVILVIIVPNILSMNIKTVAMAEFSDFDLLHTMANFKANVGPTIRWIPLMFYENFNSWEGKNCTFWIKQD